MYKSVTNNDYLTFSCLASFPYWIIMDASFRFNVE